MYFTLLMTGGALVMVLLTLSMTTLFPERKARRAGSTGRRPLSGSAICAIAGRPGRPPTLSDIVASCNQERLRERRDLAGDDHDRAGSVPQAGACDGSERVILQ